MNEGFCVAIIKRRSSRTAGREGLRALDSIYPEQESTSPVTEGHTGSCGLRDSGP